MGTELVLTPAERRREAFKSIALLDTVSDRQDCLKVLPVNAASKKLPYIVVVTLRVMLSLRVHSDSRHAPPALEVLTSPLRHRTAVAAIARAMPHMWRDA